VRVGEWVGDALEIHPLITLSSPRRPVDLHICAVMESAERALLIRGSKILSQQPRRCANMESDDAGTTLPRQRSVYLQRLEVNKKVEINNICTNFLLLLQYE